MSVRYQYCAGDEEFCRQCRVCCAWEGDVLFDPGDLEKIAQFLRMAPRACAEKYFQLARDRRHLRSRSTKDGRCVFLGEDGCRIYPRRPRQCRTFPYLWQHPENKLMKKCRLFRDIREREAENTPFRI